MKMRDVVISLSAALILVSAPSQAINDNASERAKQVINTWTKAKRNSAIPRDLVIDERGLPYLKRGKGIFTPYGHQTPPGKSLSRGKPSSDLEPPVIHPGSLNPGDGDIIGAQKTFEARVTDDSGRAQSVEFTIHLPDNSGTQVFDASYIRNRDLWAVNLSGFSDGCWQWQVDAADKSGKTATSSLINFTVDTDGTPTCAPDGGDTGDNGSGDNGYIVTNSPWNNAGTITNASGRIYFEMPDNRKRRRWSGYVCSGTVATDSVTGRSIIITAAHCVYDDVNKAFARNVLFIPNQAGTSGSGTDGNCGNDPIGCWVPDFGVVDENWTSRRFPDNIAWDYAYYVVPDSGAHAAGITATITDTLDLEAGSLPVDFYPVAYNDGNDAADSPDFTHALGYSYSDDPNFMYCAEDMTLEGSVNWWLPSCELSGGASGGAWIQDMTNQYIMSVNSWGYTTSPGMAGPKLIGTSANCLFERSKAANFVANNTPDGDAGYIGCN